MAGYTAAGIFLGISAGLDARKKQVSLWICGLFGAIALLIQVIKPEQSWGSFGGGILVGLFMLAAAYGTREAVGYGDGAAVLVCGMFLGGLETMSLLLGGLLLAAVFGVLLLLLHKIEKKQPMPFLPFLFTAYLAGCIMGAMGW